METKENKIYWGRTLASFLLVLFAMPLGHALMKIMEKYMSEGIMHVAGFMLGLVGLIMVIAGVFVKGDTRQTLWGLFGGLLFLDRLGRVSFPLLCSSLWCSTRNRKQCRRN